ncbi:hypothetical protein [Nesterenkonia rhizosphaerae]|uniref:Uncharacterized protein n=1 Tax=Nesterenkonia rhizosphaerae TaxID=1348272 RepID=A0ABP9G0S9_9MICC
MKHAPIVVLATSALLLATACGDEAPEPEPAAAAPEQAESTEPTDIQTEDAEEDPAETEGDDDLYPGMNVDLPAIGTHQVGDTFEFLSTDGFESMQVTWDAIEWLETDEGDDVALLVLSADNTAGSGTVEFSYPTRDGGGFHYISDSGEITDNYENDMPHSTTFDGEVGLFGRGDGVLPGTQESGKVIWFKTDGLSGRIAYLNDAGRFMNVLELPAESVNSDHETIQTIHERAALFDGSYIR